jgi:hypothetical protein
MKRMLALVLVSSGLARSSELPVTLESEVDVARVVMSARNEVLVLSPALRSRVVANALRYSAVSSGARLLILTDKRWVEQRSSFIPALSLLNGRARVEVRLRSGVSSTLLIVDGRQVVFGPLIAEPSTFGLEPTRLVQDAGEARAQVQGFARHWRKATPWRYRVQSPTFTNGGRK